MPEKCFDVNMTTGLFLEVSCGLTQTNFNQNVQTRKLIMKIELISKSEDFVYFELKKAALNIKKNLSDNLIEFILNINL